MRNIWIDNLRGALILLVVFGHFIEPANSTNGLERSVYLLIYLFHIPLFVGLSGYLSGLKFNFAKVFKGVILPFVLAEFAYRLYGHFVIGQTPSILTPYWVLWFLLSLACWRLILPFWMRLPAPLGLAVILGLAAGTIDSIGYTLSISRTLNFFPFFVLGYQLSQKAITNRGQQTWPYLVLVVGFLAVCFVPTSYSVFWSYGSLGYHALGETTLFGVVFRLAHYIAAVVLSIAFMMIIPRQKTVLSVIGVNTMPIFLGHGLIVLFARDLGQDTVPYIFFVSLALTFATCGLCMLANHIFKRVASAMITKQA